MRLRLLTFFLLPLASFAQTRQPDAAKIKLELKRLNSLGAVLYMAAHPDDENTRAIAYLVNDQLVTTGYLSLTRGDGGQNLIGPEIRDQLGLIRTQELMSARRLDGGQQFFTRANDFGFSKSAKETFEIWNREEVLSDVCSVIRQFQPDVILTRFPPDQRAGHGQHTASAMLAEEAFDKTNDPKVFPDQVKQWGTWQVKRLLFNTGPWWNPNINDSIKGVVTLNVGTYNKLLGKSYSELAAESRSQHKSQGFGSSGDRGDDNEFFFLRKGEISTKNIFEGVNTGWSRLKGGIKVQPLVERAIMEFNEEDPSASVPNLLAVRNAISKLDAGVWRTRKLIAVNQLIKDCLGLFAEVTAGNAWVTPSDPLETRFEILNRSNTDVKLLSISAPDLAYDTAITLTLKNNAPVIVNKISTLKPGHSYSGPYWLNEAHGQGLFTVSDPLMIGKPESNPAVSITFTFSVLGEKLIVAAPLIFKATDRVRGEVTKPFEVVPPVFVNLQEKVLLFPNASSKAVIVLVKSASSGPLHGTVKLDLPSGWRSEPLTGNFDLAKRGEELAVTFTVFPGQDTITATAKATATIDGKSYDRSIQTINYEHIPAQTLLPKAQARLVRLDLKGVGGVVAYVKGAGDEIPAGLRNMGYQVWEMKDDEVTPDNLKKVDAVVLGVRALNTNTRIRHFMPDLLDFVNNGGTMIVQYNNSFELELERDAFSPYPLSLSRDRVTEEKSHVTVLKPDHPALNFPNHITTSDFEGWVQERGLYFPDHWDAHFDALLSAQDTGETPKEGSLLVASYGKGYYVYTGLSFFRELPEGVPGAYRLFANLVSLGRTKKPESTSLKSKAK